MFQIPGLPYVNPLLGNLLYLLTGEAMEANIKYEIFISFVLRIILSLVP